MANATITVSWNGTSIIATPSTISAPKMANVNLTWAVGTGVQTLNNITTPTAASGATLNAPVQSGGVWTCADQFGNNSVTYGYTITLYTTSGTTVTQDPQIINNPNTQ